MKQQLSTILLGLLIISSSSSTFAANLVLHNAKVYTLDSQQTWADTIVISADSIEYVGNRDGADQFIKEDTVMQDLQGKLVLPGFIDAHIHVGDTFPYVFAASLNPEMTPEQVL